MYQSSPSTLGAVERDGHRTQTRVSDPTTTVAARLLTNFTRMLQAYGDLGSREAQRALRDLVVDLVFVGAVAALGLYILGLVVATAVLALSVVLAPWLAALLVLVFAALAMAVLVWLGARRLKFERVRNMIQQLVEDVRWIRTEILGSG